MRHRIAHTVLILAMQASFLFGGEGYVAIVEDLSPVIRDVDVQIPVSENVVPPLVPKDGSPANWADIFGDNLKRNGGEKSVRVELNEQRVILAWNGKNDSDGEALLIYSPTRRLDSDSQANGSQVLLSIMPLPGKPISLSRAESNVFREFKTSLVSKWDVPVATPDGDYTQLNATAPVYSAFVLKIDAIANFRDDVCRYLSAFFGYDVAIDVDDSLLQPLKYYFERGFRYFAFDVSVQDNTLSNKETILYRFKSKAAFFPMCISRIGVSGDTFVDMILVSPKQDLDFSYEVGTIHNNFVTHNAEGIDVSLNGKVPTVFSKEELGFINEALGSMFDASDTVYVQNIHISGPTNAFDKGFIGK